MRISSVDDLAVWKHPSFEPLWSVAVEKSHFLYWCLGGCQRWAGWFLCAWPLHSGIRPLSPFKPHGIAVLWGLGKASESTYLSFASYSPCRRSSGDRWWSRLRGSWLAHIREPGKLASRGQAWLEGCQWCLQRWWPLSKSGTIDYAHYQSCWMKCQVLAIVGNRFFDRASLNGI